MRLVGGKLKSRTASLRTIMAFCLAASAFAVPSAQQDLKEIHIRLSQEVRHQLLLLPYYNVFDNLEYQVQGTDTVVLLGQVRQPSLKSEAESVIRRLEGVGKVINKIEVLPLSNEDDRIRMAVYRAIFSRPGLDKYLLRAVPPIHIIVKDGNVTLVGVVSTPSDKELAGISAQGIPGIFSVKNSLTVEGN